MRRRWSVVAFIYTVMILTTVTAVLRDVVYIIDKSGSVKESDFDEAIDFVYNVTTFLKIGLNDIQVSIITYSTYTSEEFHLTQYLTNATLLSGISSLKGTRTTGWTHTYDAIDYVRLNSFLSQNGGRSNALKTVIVMTDGLSGDQNKTIEAANNIRSEIGAEVFSIGIGGAVANSNEELRGIANDPKSYYVHYVDTYIYLCNLIPALVPKLDASVTTALIANCPTPPTSTVKFSLTTTTTLTTTTAQTTSTTTAQTKSSTTTATQTTSSSTAYTSPSTTTTSPTASSYTTSLSPLTFITSTTAVLPIDTATDPSSRSNDNTGLIAGAVSGALLLLGSLAVVLALIIRRIRSAFQSEDLAVLAAVQQYNAAQMGQRKCSFVNVFKT